MNHRWSTTQVIACIIAPSTCHLPTVMFSTALRISHWMLGDIFQVSWVMNFFSSSSVSIIEQAADIVMCVCVCRSLVKRECACRSMGSRFICYKRASRIHGQLDARLFRDGRSWCYKRRLDKLLSWQGAYSGEIYWSIKIDYNRVYCAQKY